LNGGWVVRCVSEKLGGHTPDRIRRRTASLAPLPSIHHRARTWLDTEMYSPTCSHGKGRVAVPSYVL
jgi:hypothetical protein